jgi:pre-mRNA-splicing helicase BRR2
MRPCVLADARRPQHFVGVTDPNPMKRKARMNELAWERALHYVKQEQQVMIFVHSRRDTVKTAEYLQRCGGWPQCAPARALH